MFLFQTVGRVIVTWYSAIECILFSWGCVVKFQACEANSWRRSASSNPGNWVCVLSFFLSFFLYFSLALFLFFSFFPPTFSIFSRSNAHTHTNKGVDFQKGLFVRFNMARDEKFAKDLVRSTCSKSNKGGGKRRGKAESRQIYGSLLHSICGLQINVWLGAFI